MQRLPWSWDGGLHDLFVKGDRAVRVVLRQGMCFVRVFGQITVLRLQKFWQDDVLRVLWMRAENNVIFSILLGEKKYPR